jgi:uncharacterized protein YjhX (UPF0386 family)
MTDAITRLLSAKTNADKLATDRKNFAAYLQDRIEHGWDSVDVEEYRAEVSRIMKSGTLDEKADASVFWELKAKRIIGAAQGINERIRAACVSPSGTC